MASAAAGWTAPTNDETANPSARQLLAQAMAEQFERKEGAAAEAAAAAPAAGGFAETSAPLCARVAPYALR